jgi:hypothetical protein
MQACIGSGGTAPLTIISALDGGEWSTSRSGRFAPGMNSGTNYIGGLLGPRARMKALAKRKISYHYLYSSLGSSTLQPNLQM